MESDKIISLAGMYQEYFIDYASYVILERAVPALEDGLKPVQRRILHSMKRMDDGRYQKVANIIGHTMQFHPHGDASIGDALVNLGQKELLIDMQGNWGDIRTGDSAAAPRYIEARLSKFALEVVFNPQTTEWQSSYDGRNKEPVHLPVKFPLVLAQGVEGIAVGLSTKILPHNFIELIQASIKILQEKPFRIYPDFLTGGSIDVSDYQDGMRGGKVKVRAKIVKVDKSTLLITELPFGVTTGTMVESIIKATEKGQIKIKKITDNTAQNVEIEIILAPGISPEVTIDALYAFTDCEVSISPNACVIVDSKPLFLPVSEMLKISTMKTKNLLKWELEIKKGELEEKWHMASLEKIFIEKRIYRDIEECENWESVLETIDIGLKKYVSTPEDKVSPDDKRLRLMRDITEEDIIRLTEIKIKRISKYNSFKNDELISNTEDELKQVAFDLEHLTEYTIHYFNDLLEKYGKGRERRTEITTIEEIKATQVIINNAKLYVDKQEGFIGMGIKEGEFVMDCSDIDDVIAFKQDATFQVVRIGDKVFVGKNIIYAAVWKKNDERTTYNLIYVDGESKRTYAKRFQVTGITREKDYDLTMGNPNSKLLYFSVNPNGESEVVSVQLTPGCSARKKVFDFDFGELAIKGRSAGGNIITKFPVRKITFIEKGKSSLGSIKAWMDEVSGRVNTQERGVYLGEFDTGDLMLAVYKNGTYEQKSFEDNMKFEVDQLVSLSKWTSESIVSCIYYEGEREWSMIKRFKIETTTTDERFNFLSEHPQTKLYFASISQEPKVKIHYRKDNKTMEMEVGLAEFIDVKGWKAFGNKLGEFKLTKVIDLTPEIVSSDVQEIKGETDDTIYDEAIDLIDENVEQNFEQPEEINGSDEQADAGTEETVRKNKDKSKKDTDTSFKIGDTIDFDL
ncbi:MAG TPA: DNA gyrase/topoisomerase IV subunit A [Saprospiraceae bacterium]|nr:DNA gyrase/topoisomerase IV subunit A [Saprospiraceae bacterium]